MIKRLKTFGENFKWFVKNFKKMTGKEKSQKTMLIIYFFFFAFLLSFPLLLVKEVTLYTMETYNLWLEYETKVDLIMTIVLEVIYFFIAINYFTGAFNKKIHK